MSVVKGVGGQDFVAGWFGGAAGLVVGHPFDTVKVRLQTDGQTGAKIYRGTFHCFKHIVGNEGARALFKGMATPLLGVAAINAILFGINGRLMKKFQEQAGKEPLKLRYSFISGAVAGSVQVFICSPMELIKLRLQLQTEKMELFHHSSDGRLYRSPWDAAKKIYQKDGIFRGLGKGFWTTMLREVPSFAFYFGSYDFLCRSAVRYQGHSHVNEINPAVICMAGGIGGIMAWVVSYPVDVMKSRLQVDGMEGPRRYRGMLDCFRQSSREGMGVFVRGLQPTLIRAFPTNAVTFVTVSLILRAWRKPDSDS